VKSFIENVVPVIRKDIAPEKILIFGSRVRGKPHEDSDLDVIIVSDFFKGIKFVKRMTIVLKKYNFQRMSILSVTRRKSSSGFKTHPR
jgi:predicted nucleotidyltransferase